MWAWDYNLMQSVRIFSFARLRSHAAYVGLDNNLAPAHEGLNMGYYQ